MAHSSALWAGVALMTDVPVPWMIATLASGLYAVSLISFVLPTLTDLF
jgi:hypothetical protein